MLLSDRLRGSAQSAGPEHLAREGPTTCASSGAVATFADGSVPGRFTTGTQRAFIRWLFRLLHEMFRALSRDRPDIVPDKLDRLRDLMNAAIRDVLV